MTEIQYSVGQDRASPVKGMKSLFGLWTDFEMAILPNIYGIT
jgi:hypothetical protein